MIYLLSFILLFFSNFLSCYPYDGYLADKAFEGGDFLKAKELYQGLVEKDPEDFKALYNLAKTEYKQNNFEAAKLGFEKAIKNKDISLDLSEQANFNLGDTLMNLTDYKAAISSYEKVLQINPNNEHAKKRIEMAKKLLEQQQKQEQEKQDKQDKQDQKKDQENKQEQEKQDKEKNQGNKKGKDKQDKQSDQENKENKNNKQETNDKLGEKKKEKDQQEQGQKDKKEGKEKTSDDIKQDIEKQKQAQEEQGKKENNGDNADQKREQAGKKDEQKTKQHKESPEKANIKESISDLKLNENEKKILKYVEDFDKEVYKDLVRSQIKGKNKENHGYKNW